MRASLAMAMAFGKAAQENKLESVRWHDDKDTTYTANLKSINIDPIDTTQAELVYELYTETELTNEFAVHATVAFTMWYDNLSTLNIKPISLLNKGIADGTIVVYSDGKYYGEKGGHILGMMGEEEGIEQYLKGRNNG